MSQTNTQPGAISLAASEDLDANLLVGIANSSGNPVAAPITLAHLSFRPH